MILFFSGDLDGIRRKWSDDQDLGFYLYGVEYESGQKLFLITLIVPHQNQNQQNLPLMNLVDGHIPDIHIPD